MIDCANNGDDGVLGMWCWSVQSEKLGNAGRQTPAVPAIRVHSGVDEICMVEFVRHLTSAAAGVTERGRSQPGHTARTGIGQE